MPNTKLTLSALKNHWHYGKWIYLAIAVGAFFVGSMLFTTTAYRSPADRKVDFQIVALMNDVEPIQQVASGLLEAAQQNDPTLEEIGVFNIQYSGDPETDMYGVQKFTVMVAAREGAVYMMGRELTEQLAGQGALVPLDNYIADGALNVDGLDLSSATFDEPVENEDDPPTGVKHVYALPCSDLKRFMDPDIMLDVSDMYMSVMSYCPNQDTAVDVMQRLRDAMRDAQPAQPAAEIDG